MKLGILTTPQGRSHDQELLANKNQNQGRSHDQELLANKIRIYLYMCVLWFVLILVF